MRAGTLEVYKIFSGILGEKQAEQVVGYIEHVNEAEVVSHVERKIENMATKTDLANAKADMIKWMFVFWITQTLTILGVLAYFLKS